MTMVNTIKAIPPITKKTAKTSNIAPVIPKIIPTIIIIIPIIIKIPINILSNVN